MNKEYIQFIADLKQNIVQSRYAAMRLANKEQLLLYFKTGKMLSEKIESEKWGARVIKQIAYDLQTQLPGLRGFSDRNLTNMRAFYTGYQSIIFTQTVSAQLDERAFYVIQAVAQCWSLNTLRHQIASGLYKHQGKLPNNFNKILSDQLKSSALEVFRDEYLMDFISESDTEDERLFESKVLADIKNFILVMGKGFCFIGNQYRVDVGGEEFFIDLLFFNRHLQCLVAIELKRGKFKSEYAGQLKGKEQHRSGVRHQRCQ